MSDYVLTREKYEQLESECVTYVIEIEEPLPRGEYFSKYYVGYTHNRLFKHRMEQHKRGQGSKMLAACVERGINFEPIIVFPGKAWRFERRIKNRKNTPRIVDQIYRTGKLYGVKATILKERKMPTSYNGPEAKQDEFPVQFLQWTKPGWYAIDWSSANMYPVWDRVLDGPLMPLPDYFGYIYLENKEDVPEFIVVTTQEQIDNIKSVYDIIDLLAIDSFRVVQPLILEEKNEKN